MRTGALAACALISILPFAGRALAADLGPIDASPQTAATIDEAPVVPTVYGWDNFDRTGPLSNAVTPSGAIWRSRAGTWTSDGTAAKLATNTNAASIVIDAPAVDASVVATITPQNGNPRPGLVINDDGTNSMLVVYSQVAGGQLVLMTSQRGVQVTVASAGGLNGQGTPFELRVTSIGTQISVFVDDQLAISYALTGATACLIKHIGCEGNGVPNTGFGLYASRDTGSVFDDFRIEAP
jgi:hypothetical protein